jgi:ATP-dependent RNA helicase DOB1
MVLNLLRVEGINPEFMLERSFYQFQHFSSIPALYESKFQSIDLFYSIFEFLELQTYEQQYDAIKIENEDDIARYYKLKKKLELVQDQMSTIINEPKYILPFLQPGRLVTVSYMNIRLIGLKINYIFRLNLVILISIGV